MRFDDLDTMSADEVRAVDLRLLLHHEREWLASCAVASLGNTSYAAALEPSDFSTEIMLCISDPEDFMMRHADKPADARARSLRAYCMQIIRTQWRRRFHSQYTACGHTDLTEVESVIGQDNPNYLRTCGVSIEQEAVLQWEEHEDSERRNTQLESLRDLFPPRQFEVLQMSLLDDLGAQDSARLLNCSTNNVHSLLRKARAQLLRIYESQSNPPEASDDAF